MISLSLTSPVPPALTPNHHSRHKNSSADNISFESLKTRLIRHANVGHLQEAISTLDLMSRSNLTPDLTAYSVLLKSCIRTRNFELGRVVHSKLADSRLELDAVALNSLISLYSKGGDWRKAQHIFSSMGEMKDLVSWSAMISCYAHNGLNLEAIQLFFEMVEFGEACGNLFNPRLGEQIQGHALKFGLATVNCVGNSLISMYAKNDRIEDARKAFEFLFEKNLVSYNALVDGYTRNLDSDEAFELFNQIESSSSSVGVDAFTFASLLSGAASVGAVGKGEQLHARLLKAGFESNVCISNALISMYTRCGDIEAGFRVFNEMEDRNVISWTSIITGFAKHGYAKRALQLFNQMLDSGIEPNEVTYIAVLSACSHAGLIDEGWRHFESMHKEHGIRPRMDHYACMVDVLGRSGYLNKALEFIHSMPFTADALVWRTLLSACCVHGDTELGKHAAEMILEQDPNDPAAHVLLSNLYASKGQWEDVMKTRKGMKERSLLKEAGCSWIEIGNKVHKFHVGDTKHSKASEIYDELERLATRIKELGYVPDTNFVLHEVEEEQKEQYLFQHSEKIALAYGLISSAEAKPIRIFKNLRVCGDCHAAMKLKRMKQQKVFCPVGNG
ncbi:hypothetical protein ACS0TY_000015 [Phlomoides rotata]